MEAVIGAGLVEAQTFSVKCEIWRGLLYVFSDRTVEALSIYTIT
jgi:hypothetical protein